MKTISLLDIPIFYINMDQDADKRVQLEKTLSDRGFKSVTRVPGVEGIGKINGITAAHIKAISYAIESVGFPFIVLEDDVVLNNINTDVILPADADAIYLGISTWGVYNGTGHKQISVEKYDQNFYRVYNMLSTHAIMFLSLDYAKMILRSYEFFLSASEAMDKANAELAKYFNVYGLTNPLFYQSGINQKYTDFSLPGPKGLSKKYATRLR
jgi:hypothetical protein